MQNQKFVFKTIVLNGIFCYYHDKKKINFDLLLLQQKKRIQKQFKNMKASLINFTSSDWKSLNKLEKLKISKFKRQSEIKYSNKIEWLWKKQKG